MKIIIIALGKIKKKYLKEGIEDYILRLSKFCKVNIIEINEEVIINETSKKEIENALKIEADKIKKYIPENSYVCALDINGELVSSENIADIIEKNKIKCTDKIVFIIGSSFGLSSDLDTVINKKISFGKITMPHQLFRLVLLEQIYRANKIINNEPYHK